MKRPQWLIEETSDYYHRQSKENLSSHRLADFRRCPLLYFKKLKGLIADKDSIAYSFGRAAHTLILEGWQTFESEYAVGGPINPKTGKPFGSSTKMFADWAATVGKPVITSDELVTLELMERAVLMHPQAPALIADGIAEGVCRIEYCGLPCQIRMDYYQSEYGLVDLKTCEDMDKFEFDARRYGYLHQVAFYRSVLKEASGIEADVHIIACEKREPYRCGVWKVSQNSLSMAQRENERAIEELKDCIETDFWPTRFEDVRYFDLY